MKLAVLVLFAALLLFWGGGANPKTTQLLAENRKMKRSAELYRTAAGRDDAAGRAVRTELRLAREKLAVIEKERLEENGAMRRQLEETKIAFHEYRSAYRAKARAVGRMLGRVDCAERGIFEDVEILQVSAAELTFRHSCGMGRVPLDVLPPSTLEEMDYVPAEAQAWRLENPPPAPILRFLTSDGLAQELKDKRAVAALDNISANKARKKRSAATLRRRLVYQLEGIYAAGRQLKTNQNADPSEKRQQMAEWSEQAAKLKKIIATIPSN